MAITKLLRIKERKSGSKSSGLLNCLNYILDEEKTQNGQFVYGNCGSNPRVIYDEMTFNKTNWHNESGSQGFHYIISFSAEEKVSHETALAVAKDFCHDLLCDEFLYVAAVHCDTSHTHVHICFDSVNCKSGRKFHSPKYDWSARLQPLTDKICSRYNLSALTFDPTAERKGQYHQEWEEQGKNTGSWNDLIRDDIDYALSQSSSWDDFKKYLHSMHYEIHDGRYLSLKPYGKEKFVRSARLGSEYLKERLQERLLDSTILPIIEGRTYKTYSNPIPIFRIIRYKTYLYNPFQSLFFFRWKKLSHIRKPNFDSSWKYKSAVTNLSKLSEQLIYLFENDISSIDDVANKLKQLSKVRGSEASKERKLCKGIIETYEEINKPSDIIHDKCAYKVPLLSEEKVYQIHVNQILFSDNIDFDNETFTVRIPGGQEYVLLYSEDSCRYGNNMISSYIYSNAEYQITDKEGNSLRRITGDALKNKFKNKEIERKQNGKTIS